MGFKKQLKYLFKDCLGQGEYEQKNKELLKKIIDENEIIQINVESQVELQRDLLRVYNNGEKIEAFFFYKQLKGKSDFFINKYSSQINIIDEIGVNATYSYHKILSKIRSNAANSIHDLINILEFIQKSQLDEEIKNYSKVLIEAWQEREKEYLKWEQSN